MNATHAIAPATVAARAGATPARAVLVPMPIRHIHRERDFGVGYGNSSGYASTHRYAGHHIQRRFRCV